MTHGMDLELPMGVGEFLILVLTRGVSQVASDSATGEHGSILGDFLFLFSVWRRMAVSYAAAGTWRGKLTVVFRSFGLRVEQRGNGGHGY